MRGSLWERFKNRFKSEDIDEHIHQLKSVEASDINNDGLGAQFDYLIVTAGPDFVEQLLDEQ